MEETLETIEVYIHPIEKNFYRRELKTQQQFLF